ncbi:MAG: NAD-dependent epimerase/dehydratase family protein [Bacteroidetes bacterium]|nr:NAD-dependent epimerase/dehydratase family protein [Bacteroidota bacterium]MBU1718806.1 NAD-dependent epimerase/dehydratase family protein [Bacteroidota bacterium]
MRTSLVTGGAGFIGAHVVNSLIENGHNVIVIDDLSGGFEDNINPKAKFIKGCITESKLIAEIFQQYKFDYVYHLAAYAAEGLSHFIKRFNYNHNLIGSINLINESVKNEVKCFVFTSSIAVYGSNQVPMREDLIPEPEDSYGISKYAVEMELKVTHEMFGLDYIVFRPHNVYGEYQNIGDKYRNVVGIFMNQLMEGNKLSVFGDGEQTRAFSYIGDVAPYIAKSVDIPDAYNEVFNIGADQEFTVKKLASEVMKVMAMENELLFLEPRNEVKHAYSDHSKAKKVFKIDHFTPLDEGLAKMANWAKQVGARKTKPFANIEILKNLPEFWLK